MNIIDLAREFGKAIQGTEEYKKLDVARAANDSDPALQEMVAQFNTLGAAMEQEADKESPDEKLVDQLNASLTELYAKIMDNERMEAFNEAKEVIDEQMNAAFDIISAAINGEDPATYQPEEHDHDSCGGECGGCHGCS